MYFNIINNFTTVLMTDTDVTHMRITAQKVQGAGGINFMELSQRDSEGDADKMHM